MYRLLLIVPLLLSGCLAGTYCPSTQPVEADRLLQAGLRELLENRPAVTLEQLQREYPRSEQAQLAERLRTWKPQPPSAPNISATSKTGAPNPDLRELKEENRRLRADLEQLRRLLIESEKRAR